MDHEEDAKLIALPGCERQQTRLEDDLRLDELHTSAAGALACDGDAETIVRLIEDEARSLASDGGAAARHQAVSKLVALEIGQTLMLTTMLATGIENRDAKAVKMIDTALRGANTRLMRLLGEHRSEGGECNADIRQWWSTEGACATADR